ncbi:MAG: peptidase, partial [Nitrosopumilus sp.]|nr:peptidase [Nitrosopumilus sp.]
SDTVRVHLFTDDLNNNLISIDAGPIQRVPEGQTVTLSVTGETLNKQPIRYSWVQMMGTQVNLSSFIGDEITFIAPEVGVNEELLSFRVTGYSPGSGYANDLALVKVIPSNASPIADAGVDQNVRERTFVHLEGSGTDPDNDKIKYSWSQKSGIPIDLHQRTTSSVYFISPTIQSLSESLVFELKVNDIHGLSDTDDVTINVISPNSPPIVYAGTDKRVLGGSSVSIMGTAVDVDSDSLKIEWKQIFGDTVNFDKTNLKLSFTAPDVSPTVSKRLAFELTATDPQGLFSSDQVIVYVSPENSSPKANAGMDLSVNENTMTDLKCIGSDPDGDSLGYNWTTSSNAIIEQSTSSSTSVKIPKVLRDTTITMTCSVNDGQNSASDSMNIMIKNMLDLDIVSDAGDDKIVNENVKVTLDGSKSNDPEDQKLNYKWTQISGEQVKLSSTTGLTASFTSPVVANNQIKVLTFELKVFDDNGRVSTDVVTITVDPVNSTPEAIASAKQ